MQMKNKNAENKRTSRDESEEREDEGAVLPDPISFETDLEKLEPFTSNGHQWHQEGPYLICESCSVRHSSFIGIEKVLKGFTENGQPILEKRF